VSGGQAAVSETVTGYWLREALGGTPLDTQVLVD